MSKQQDELREKVKTIIIGIDNGNWYDAKADAIMQVINSTVQAVLDKVEEKRKNYTIDQCSIAFHNVIKEVRKDYE